ncbi:MAG: response regulator transcription factor [Acidimicrobiales bacterium]|jgi:DNA-binding NarL/FixJ family response regulator
MSDGATPLRIVVADDQRAVREALATVLDAELGFEVVGLAADGEEAVELAHRLSPAVVLMDLRMPNVDGVAATRRLAAELPAVKVVVLTTFADDASIMGALEAGALGFLTKDAGREQIALAVRSAAAGQAVLDPLVQASLLRAASPAGTGADAGAGAAAAVVIESSVPAAPMPAPLPDDLTPREADVLHAIAAGQSNSEIAATLFISEVTVKSHINHLFAKIHARNRAEAVRYAYDHGLVRPGS